METKSVDNATVRPAINIEQNTIPLNSRLQLRDFIAGYFVFRATHVAAELDIAGVLVDEPKTCESLAKRTNTHAQTLYRLLRALASFGIFAEDPSGRFSNTELSQPLRSDIADSVRPSTLMFGGETMLMSRQALLHSVQTGESAFEHVFGAERFEYLSRHPDEAKLFDDAMVSVSSMMNAQIAQAYDFSDFATLVDVAGGYGSTLCTILKANPALRGLLFDMPHVIEGARTYIADQGLSDRCEVVAGDFFAPLPAGADAYFLKHIVHDWDDVRCIRILRNCRTAMPGHARLLVCERIVSPANTASYSKLGDLLMLTMTPGGRERTEREFRALFQAAGFRLERLVATEPEHTVLECAKHKPLPLLTDEPVGSARLRARDARDWNGPSV